MTYFFANNFQKAAPNGHRPGYRADIDEIHETLRIAREADQGRHPDPIVDAAERAALGL